MPQNIVVVGGGTGGTVLANRLAEKLAPEIDAGDARVTLVTDDTDHVYKPTFLYVPFGRKTVADARRPLSELLDSRVEVEYNRVVGVDTDEKTIALQDGHRTMAYDQLVLSMGARVVPEVKAIRAGPVLTFVLGKKI